jgi:metallo-beta-lactamase family protein
MPLHLDPTSPPACDFLVVESTYGDRQHPQESLGAQILEPFEKTFKRGGTVLIPAFAVGRAQLVTVVLHELMQSGKIPEVPVHIDSPMAVDATRIYGRHLRDENLDPDVLEEGRSPLFPSFVRFHRSVQESRKLNELPGPRIIISASGMLTAGRVLHHLARLLPERRNLVVLSGYQAAGTRGRALMEGARHLRIHGEEVPVKAEFMPLSGMSAHADSDELVRWVGAAENKPKAVFVTHGEPEASAALAKRLEGELGLRTIVPAMRDSFDLMRLMK